MRYGIIILTELFLRLLEVAILAEEPIHQLRDFLDDLSRLLRLLDWATEASTLHGRVDLLLTDVMLWHVDLGHSPTTDPDMDLLKRGCLCSRIQRFSITQF
jgi:hypothetical protein